MVNEMLNGLSCSYVYSHTHMHSFSYLTREMVDPAIYTNNDMIIVPARCQAIHPPSQKLFLRENTYFLLLTDMYGLTPSGYIYHIILSTGKDLP